MKPNRMAPGERRPRPPLAEDERGEGDEPGAVGHVVLEPGLRLEREPGAAEPGDEPADHHGAVADADRIDAERSRRRAGARRPTAPAARTRVRNSTQARDGDDHEHGEEDRLVGEELRADDRDVGQQRQADGGRWARRWRCPVSTSTSERRKPVRPEGEQVDDDAGDDLVDPEGDARAAAWSSAMSPPVSDGDADREPQRRGAVGVADDGVGRGSPCTADVEHHALDADVHDAGALAPEPGHGPERDRGAQAQRLDQQLHHVGVRGLRQREGQDDDERDEEHRAAGSARRWPAAGERRSKNVATATSTNTMPIAVTTIGRVDGRASTGSGGGSKVMPLSAASRFGAT